MTDYTWEVRPLGSMLLRRPRYGINAPASASGSGGRPYIRITDIDDGRFRPSPRVEVCHAGSAAYLLHPGDVLFARTGASVGKSYRYDPADGQLVFAGFLINITPNPSILNPGYLATYVQSAAYWNWVAATSVRSGQPGINGREYALMPLPVPPIEVQDSISEAMADCDAEVDTIECLIAKKQAINQGVAQLLVTGATRLPGFTASWRQVLLGSHVSYLKTVPLSRAQLDTTSPIRYLHYGDIHTSDSLFLAAADVSMPRAPAGLAGPAGRLQVGDLVFADASEDPAGVGRSVEIASAPTEGLIPGLHTIAARFDKDVLADGFKAYLQLHPTFRRSLLRLAAGTKVLATTRSSISSVEMSLPPVDEQHAIAQVLSDADAEIDLLKLRLEKAKAIKQGMAQHLFIGKTRLPVLEAMA